jgi:sterol desaturase/sphingolipid hydroxylase (fatty acid hydroxylase superfamily)
MSTLVFVAVPVFIVLLALEAWLSARSPAGRRGYTWRDTAASLSMGVGNVIVAAVAKGSTAAVFLWLHQFALFDLGYQPWVWALAFLGDDFCYYWFHRCHHEVRFLWAAHENHHSSRFYNLSTALRQSWTTPFTGPIFWAPLALLGVPPAMILVAQGVSLVYQFWLHTEWIGKLGRFEWIFNTPSHHRVHHGRDVQYLDRNHAGILIVWDRLFGTFEEERAPVDYGLTTNIETYNPLRIAFHEWAAMFRDARAAKSPGDALRYLLKPPGWSPDGSTHTARELQAGLG